MDSLEAVAIAPRSASAVELKAVAMPSPPIAQIESQLARVHKLLWNCAVAADLANMPTLYDDLSGLLLEIERLQFALVAGGGRLRTSPRNRAYPSLFGGHRDRPTAPARSDPPSEA